MKYKPAQVRKALTALATATSQAIALGLLDGTPEKVALVVLSALGVYGVFKVPNGE